MCLSLSISPLSFFCSPLDCASLPVCPFALAHFPSFPPTVSCPSPLLLPPTSLLYLSFLSLFLSSAQMDSHNCPPSFWRIWSLELFDMALHCSYLIILFLRGPLEVACSTADWQRGDPHSDLLNMFEHHLSLPHRPLIPVSEVWILPPVIIWHMKNVTLWSQCLQHMITLDAMRGPIKWDQSIPTALWWQAAVNVLAPPPHYCTLIHAHIQYASWNFVQPCHKTRTKYWLTGQLIPVTPTECKMTSRVSQSSVASPYYDAKILSIITVITTYTISYEHYNVL